MARLILAKCREFIIFLGKVYMYLLLTGKAESIDILSPKDLFRKKTGLQAGVCRHSELHAHAEPDKDGGDALWRGRRS